MKIGVFAVLFGNKPFEETLDYLVDIGLSAVEIGTGAYPGNAHCQSRGPARQRPPAEGIPGGHRAPGPDDQRPQLPRQPAAPRHAKIARAHHKVFMQTVQLAAKLGVGPSSPSADARAATPRPAAQLDRLAVAARVRAGARVAVEGARHPVLEGDAKVCRKAGVRVAIEMHPNFVVYNPETMRRLRPSRRA